MYFEKVFIDLNQDITICGDFSNESLDYYFQYKSNFDIYLKMIFIWLQVLPTDYNCYYVLCLGQIIHEIVERSPMAIINIIFGVTSYFSYFACDKIIKLL